MRNFSPVRELRFQPGYCFNGKFQLGYRDEQGWLKFHPGNRVGVFIWESFQPGYRDLGRKNRYLGNRAGSNSHMNTCYLHYQIIKMVFNFNRIN